jgi:hypothetical protein
VAAPRTNLVSQKPQLLSISRHAIALTVAIVVFAGLIGSAGARNIMDSVTSSSPVTYPPVSTFSSTADTYVSSSSPAVNFGGQKALDVIGQPVQRTYVRFDLSSYYGPVGQATLKVWSRNASTAGFDVRSVGSTSWRE